VSVDGIVGERNCVEVWDDKTDPERPMLRGYACAQADEANGVESYLIDANGDMSFSHELTIARRLQSAR
jgi:hypothetical protein